jgi:glycosyltransferase involved in cell wall biosynthesis
VRERAVVHVCESLATGVLEVVRGLANHTAAAGVPTVVVHGRRPETPADVEQRFHPSVRLVAVDGWGERRPVAAAGGMVRAAAALREELRRYGGGVVHVHSTYAGLVARLVPGNGWNVFYSPHAYAFLNRSVSPLARGVSLASEAVLGRRGHTIAVSRSEGAVAARLVGRGRVVVVQNGVEPRPVAVGRDDERPFRVACVGRASFQRRPDLFADVARRLRGELDAEFVWAGDGPEGDLLAGAGVEVTGWLAPAEVSARLAGADVVVHLSAFEGLPFALLEAMSAGRAIVASDVPPIREALGDAGILVESADDTVAAIRRLHADSRLRRALGEAARSRAERLFTRRAMIERTVSAYGLSPAA